MSAPLPDNWGALRNQGRPLTASSFGGNLHLWAPRQPEDETLRRMNADRLHASILMDELRSVTARLVPGQPQIVLEFADIVAARLCFALIWPEEPER